MTNKIAITIIGIFLISIVSAITIDSGSCETIEIETDNKVFWTASGNSSSLDGINITQEGKNITICLDVMFEEDSFSILIIEEQTKEIVKEVRVGGSSRRTRTIYEDRNIIEYVNRDIIKEVNNTIVQECDITDSEERFNFFPLIALVVVLIVYLWVKFKR